MCFNKLDLESKISKERKSGNWSLLLCICRKTRSLTSKISWTSSSFRYICPAWDDMDGKWNCSWKCFSSNNRNKRNWGRGGGKGAKGNLLTYLEFPGGVDIWFRDFTFENVGDRKDEKALGVVPPGYSDAISFWIFPCNWKEIKAWNPVATQTLVT